MTTIRNYVLSAVLLVSVFGCAAFSQNENVNNNEAKVFSASEASSIGEDKVISIKNTEDNKTVEKENIDSERQEFVNSVLEMATSLEGVPYVYAGKSPKGFDCSGFVYYVFKNHNIALPASSRMYDKVGKTISLENAKEGDIICFTGTDPNIDRTGHVGIVVENKKNEPIKFIHATSGKRYSVAYSTLSKDGKGHYAKRFRSIRRVAPKK
ncbi:C40 family peptidase [Bernardetia sp. ABR2-2B]|uniref:C40 family peptidase n=1 Tax=Bernardetia sp. ABR2-2B TaxID=3127472 RepID=UPI0030CF50A1